MHTCPSKRQEEIRPAMCCCTQNAQKTPRSLPHNTVITQYGILAPFYWHMSTCKRKRKRPMRNGLRSLCRHTHKCKPSLASSQHACPTNFLNYFPISKSADSSAGVTLHRGTWRQVLGMCEPGISLTARGSLQRAGDLVQQLRHHWGCL